MKKISELIKKNKQVSILLFALGIFYFFAFNHIGKFETADEHYWIYSNTSSTSYWKYNNGRIVQYWNALLSGNLKKTRINDKPGITLAYVDGVGAYLRNNLEKKLALGEIAPLSKIEKAERVNFYFRFPQVLFVGLFVFGLFFLLRKFLHSEWMALFASTLMLLSPILIGMSQIINPDSLLWLFAFASLISFLIYLRDDSRKFAGFSSIFLGLALLTKYSSVILFPFYFLVLFIFILENEERFSEKGGWKKIIQQIVGYLLVLVGALVIYAVLLPDNLIEFKHFLKGSVGFKGMYGFFLALLGANAFLIFDAYFFESAIVLKLAQVYKKVGKYLKLLVIAVPVLAMSVVVLNTIFGHDILKLFAIPFDASPKAFFSDKPWRVFLSQFVPLTFSLAPLVLIAFLYASIKNFGKKSVEGWLVFVAALFVLVYVAAVIQQKVPLSVRYSIMLYPIVLTVAAIGMVQFLEKFKQIESLKIIALVLLMFFGVIKIWSTSPFYLNYTSFLLPSKYLISDGWGYGGYEAAEYLNKMPNAEKLRIWADYNGVCVFFNGGCNANTLTMKNIQKKADKKGSGLPRYEFFVSMRRGYNLSAKLWDDLKEKYASKQIFEIIINKRPENYIRVFKNN